jgi:tripartite-type tricarboxylate transporter receptor subunit TctC
MFVYRSSVRLPNIVSLEDRRFKGLAMKKLGLVLIAAAAVLSTANAPAHAQAAYPNRVVRIIVPFPAGGTADVLPRIVAEKLAQRWGQPVVVENRTGAGGNIGAEAAARAEPDGYTLLASPPGPLAINQNLYRSLAFDPAKFVPISVLATVPNVLATRAALPAASVQDLIAHARSNPGKLVFASQGSGSTSHLTASMFQSMAKVDMVHVPYKGTAPALTDLIGGHVDLFFDNLGSSLVHHKAGKLRILAVTSPKRVAALPDIPTVAEAGLPGFASVTWFAVVAPEGTAPAIAQQVSGAIASVLAMPEVRKRFEEQAADPVGGTPAETAAFIREETDRWQRVIKAAHVTPN